MDYTLFVLSISGLICPILTDFPVLWNVPSKHCYINGKLKDLSDYNIVENTGHNFNGDKVVIFYEFTFGRYPYFKKYDVNQPVNGGSPLNENSDTLLKEHLKIAEVNITKLIPDVNFSGLAVIDFEEWRPLLRYNGGVKSVYQREAIKFTEEKNGGHNSVHINNTATLLFDEAAKNFINATLHLAKRLRPKAHWGLYGFPYCNYDAGKKDTDFSCSKTFQTFNDDMKYIYDVSTALFPSIYLGFEASAEQRFRYAILTEARRIATKHTPPLPIFPYTKFEYNPLKEVDSFYNDSDICTTIKQPADMGVDGLVFWSSSSNMTLRCDNIEDYLQKTLGPYMGWEELAEPRFDFERRIIVDIVKEELELKLKLNTYQGSNGSKIYESDQ
ncbi:unnamed protein product [Heligmosomoides polygyrus]|uniref:Hyaluronidase n=1 Tax=Heligmosomoides polygyrus TaxID=6339 RepID=A0A3P8AQV6_HELPZ|nr:unnamed protein product [Heligmosomoides polygyrus]